MTSDASSRHDDIVGKIHEQAAVETVGILGRIEQRAGGSQRAATLLATAVAVAKHLFGARDARVEPCLSARTGPVVRLRDLVTGRACYREALDILRRRTDGPGPGRCAATPSEEAAHLAPPS